MSQKIKLEKQSGPQLGIRDLADSGLQGNPSTCKVGSKPFVSLMVHSVEGVAVREVGPEIVDLPNNRGPKGSEIFIKDHWAVHFEEWQKLKRFVSY
ncbi:hypothetical protein N7457_006237 [Penicillium paradoxum]|uniref:uncharacterized protein n=1 Tax=Penicillium paradoxum TaxID=176176 RepID=UPI0025466E0D|nr:uncharacterized protein N7457_006237 [Penicillium paradoxum]KAJ5781077.1 hypothetical protein N7457_006237 [Penicillium paradoxum]